MSVRAEWSECGTTSNTSLMDMYVMSRMAANCWPCNIHVWAASGQHVG